MRGRKPVPTHLKIIRGNPGKRTISQDEPDPEPGAVQPEWLSAEASQHWPIVAKQLGDAGVLTQMDAVALGLYCEAFARWRNANEQVAKFGPIVKSKTGFPVQSPFLAIANKAWEQMMKMLIEFGMTPSSRTRVTRVKPKAHDKAYAEFARAS